MDTSEELLRRRRAVVPMGLPCLTELGVDKGEGAALLDLEGRRFLDFATGIGVTDLGQCPPAIVDAIADQARRLLHTCIHVASYTPYVEVCEQLAALVPHGRVHGNVLRLLPPLTVTDAELCRGLDIVCEQLERASVLLAAGEAG